MEINLNLLLVRLLGEIPKVAADVVKVSVGEGRGLEWGVDVDEFSLSIPSTQRDACFG